MSPAAASQSRRLAILRLLQPPGRVTGGRVLFEGRDLLHASGNARCERCAAARISLIFQEPMTALNPTMRVGDQIAEALTAHGVGHRRGPSTRQSNCSTPCASRMPARRARDYPHQLSGGMRQRVMIAIALACRPPLVIADEPTTALDVTIQAQVLEMLRELKERFNLALLLITHDFGVIAEMADRVAVMRGGQSSSRARPSGPAPAFARVHTPPAQRSAWDGPALMPLLEVRHLVKHFSRGGGLFVRPPARRSRCGRRELLALTRATCSGWSANREAARARPAAASSGSSNPTAARSCSEARTCSSTPRAACALRGATCRSSSRIRILTEPRMRARDIVEEPLIIHRLGSPSERRRQGRRNCSSSSVSMPRIWGDTHTSSAADSDSESASRARWRSIRRSSSPTNRYRHWTSRFRRRSSSCCWSCRARLRLTYLFIAHDLRLVEHVCNRVAVMYLGRIVEMGDTQALFENPTHPYTGRSQRRAAARSRRSHARASSSTPRHSGARSDAEIGSRPLGGRSESGRPSGAWRTSFSTCPSRRWIVRCANAAISASCVTSTMVLPASCSRANSAMISLPVFESRLPVGSSASRIDGLLTRALAIATRWR